MTKLTPMKAIRKKCIDCCCGSKQEVKLCTCEYYPLFPFRMGHRPLDDKFIAETKKNASQGKIKPYRGITERRTSK